jgi:hypothetical protein
MSHNDENLKSFDKRLQRVDPDFKPTKTHKLKRALSVNVRMPWMKVAVMAVFVYGTMTVVKVVMENELGVDGFDQKVARLADGDDGSKIAAKLLWRDPVMAFVQEKVL